MKTILVLLSCILTMTIQTSIAEECEPLDDKTLKQNKSFAVKAAPMWLKKSSQARNHEPRVDHMTETSCDWVFWFRKLYNTPATTPMTTPIASSVSTESPNLGEDGSEDNQAKDSSKYEYYSAIAISKKTGWPTWLTTTPSTPTPQPTTSKLQM